jgi:putative hydrolase
VTDRGFVDLHMHTFFSDGELLPSELVQRAVHKGCRGLAITDHVDSANLDFVLARIVQFIEELGAAWRTPVVPGVELTHVPPFKIAALTERARDLGARWVVVHGETIVEPVAADTNRAAIEAGVDLLAHPGLIEPDLVRAAAENRVYLEITTRAGHSLSNGWVVRQAKEWGARLLLNTDAHTPGDIIDGPARIAVAQGAGLDPEDIEGLRREGFALFERLAG